MKFFNKIFFTLFIFINIANISIFDIQALSFFRLNVCVAKEQKIPCPAKNFYKFIEIFSENKQVQRYFTRSSIENQFVDATSDPDGKIILRIIDKNEIKFPVIPSRSERGKKLLNLKIEFSSSRDASVILEKQDTCFLVKYFFYKDGNCWFLKRIEDWSL